jgi:hypothetical protein
MNSPPSDAGLFLREVADARQTLLASPTFRDVGGVIPRSGYTQQPGVAAQRRTPDYEIPEMNAEGVLQPGGFHFGLNPTRILRRCQSRTCDTTAETHPETIPYSGARAVSGCTPSMRRRVTGLRKMLRSRSATETRAVSVVELSPILMIRVSSHEPCRRANASSQAGTECGHDPQRRQSGWTVSPDFDTHLQGSHAGRSGESRPSEMACGILSRTQCADRPAREIGPCLPHCHESGGGLKGCRTPSAFGRKCDSNLGCVAARRPQANGYNRVAVLTMAWGDPLSV